MPGILRAAKGIMLACALTMAAMALLAVWIVYGGLGTEHLTLINQLIKAVSIAAGVFFAVGRGGEKGLYTGAVVGILYILIGYGVYCLADGSRACAWVMAIEEAAGAFVGAVSGICAANMRKPRRAAKRV